MSDNTRATMRDVARLAEVSLKTVSRVVNGVSSVNPEIAARVRRAARQLNYQPNLTASTLRRRDGRSTIIGLLVDDVANPFSASLYRAVEDVANTHNVSVAAGSVHEDPDRERRLVTNFIGRQVDGLIVMSTAHDHSYLRDHQQAGTPVVFADRPPVLLAADSVLSDNRRGAERGTRYLVESGHRRIAYLGHKINRVTAIERYRGYLDGLARAGVPEDLELVRHDLSSLDLVDAAIADMLALADPPTAVFTSQNLVTIRAIRSLRARGLQHSIAMVGFDDFLLADMLEPSVTVIAQDPTAMGRLAAEILFRRIGGDQSPPQQHVLDSELVVRESGLIGQPAVQPMS
ncbi:LacI family DNA-binding transcriptional regulator [Amycolatopsis thermoflava]|uniref:LacI family transcriptional regulator n=1 Tax=Amycolatopsis thermoflava TaxID=84480 RepID=A0A3N2H4Z1_9PSEU|nr:LacI family DNA-binding transcriptional regulator [Amycolatopsis thermoflava]ROS43974.1 LacI family transcriptional regulator [Amycolatopsis thermoflava]